MSILPPEDPTSPSYGGDQKAVWRDIRALWRKVDAMGKGGGGVGVVIVDDTEPADAQKAVLWYDTDAGL